MKFLLYIPIYQKFFYQIFLLEIFLVNQKQGIHFKIKNLPQFTAGLITSILNAIRMRRKHRFSE